MNQCFCKLGKLLIATGGRSRAEAPGGVASRIEEAAATAIGAQRLFASTLSCSSASAPELKPSAGTQSATSGHICDGSSCSCSGRDNACMNASRGNTPGCGSYGTTVSAWQRSSAPAPAPLLLRGLLPLAPMQPQAAAACAAPLWRLRQGRTLRSAAALGLSAPAHAAATPARWLSTSGSSGCTSSASASGVSGEAGVGGSGGNGGNGVSGGGGGGDGGGSPLAQIQPRVVMVFTCAKCDTRSTKAFSKTSYTRGVVLVRCPGCQKLHLIADHLGWFGEEPFVLHEFIEKQGGNVVRISAAAAAQQAAAEAGAGGGGGGAIASAGADAGSPGSSEASARDADPAEAEAEADPGLAARAAAAAAAAVGSEGGVFELSSASQVHRALEEARELQRQRQQHAASKPEPPKEPQQG